MALQVIKATQSISKASDFRNDIQMLLQPYANWETYLVPAPKSIAIMGELIFISSKGDFSVNKNPPVGGFKHIKYPDSFRACLLQVCNATWHAFSEAQKNMAQIHLHTGTVPEYIKTIVKTLFKDKIDLQDQLPNQLENIDSIAKECLKLAKLTENKFKNAIELTQELIEACINAKRGHKMDLEDIEQRLKEANLREKASRDYNDRAKKAFEVLDKQLDEAQSAYEMAMDSLPNGWSMVGMNLLQGLTASMFAIINGIFVTNTLFAVVNVALVASKTIKSILPVQKTSTTKEDQNPEDEKSRNDPFASNYIFSKSSYMVELTSSMTLFLEDDQIKWSEVYDQKNRSARSDFPKKQFENIKLSISKEEECEPKAEALEICDNGIQICTELAKYIPDGKCGDTKTNELVQGILDLHTSAQKFDSKSKAFTNTPAFVVQPPNLSRAVVSAADDGVAKKVMDQARLRLEQYQAHLDRVRRLYAKSVESMEKNQKELSDIVTNMAKLDVEKADTISTLELLAQGLEALGKVDEQWKKMLLFFDVVTNITQAKFLPSLKTFLKTVEGKLSFTPTYTSEMFVKDMLYLQALNASVYANVVNAISGTYTEVSEKYLMDRVKDLSRLMSLDPSDDRFKLERSNLHRACEQAEEGIISCVKKSEDDLYSKSQSRLDSIKAEFQAVIPPLPIKQQEKLKEVVMAGFKEPTDEDLDQFS